MSNIIATMPTTTTKLKNNEEKTEISSIYKNVSK